MNTVQGKGQGSHPWDVKKNNKKKRDVETFEKKTVGTQWFLSGRADLKERQENEGGEKRYDIGGEKTEDLGGEKTGEGK